MSEESLKSLGITDEDLSHDWMAVCREVSCDNEEYEYASEDDEDDDSDDDDYNGDDGHYDEDNPIIPESTSSSLLAKYLWRKLKNADMAALTASLERVNITISSTDQNISAGDLARDTTLTNNHDEAVATVNKSVFDDTPIPFNFVEHHAPVDIDSVTLVRLLVANESSTTRNVPSNNTIPQLCSKREWFAANGRDTSCNPAPKKREMFGRSGLSLTNADWRSEKSLLSLDFLIRSDELNEVVDAVRNESDDISISDAFISQIIDNLDCNEDNQLIASSTTKKKKRKPRVIDFSTPIEPTEGDILFGRGGDVYKHPGNVRFREKARELAPSYEACGDSKDSNEEKYKVSEDFVDCMKAENRRFLEKGPDGLWYEVLGNGIRKKASQALREKKTRGLRKSV
jgi:hypothetical protein